LYRNIDEIDGKTDPTTRVQSKIYVSVVRFTAEVERRTDKTVDCFTRPRNSYQIQTPQ